VGGGGLISGVGAWLKRDTISHASRLIGVQSEASAFFHTIFHQGTQEGVVELDSLADGLAGPVEDRSKTIPMVSHYVDDLILVSEQEIAQAITFAWRRYQEKIEGSAATALAAVISGKIQARPAVIVITGGNIQPEMHQRIIAGK
ncbi:MAG: pyridoxal-phosphate dependent enzyme, partial [Chloroflexota bacterium]